MDSIPDMALNSGLLGAQKQNQSVSLCPACNTHHGGAVPFRIIQCGPHENSIFVQFGTAPGVFGLNMLLYDMTVIYDDRVQVS